MAAARYWRIASVEPYAYQGLELSEVALYTAVGRVDGTATVSATLAPTAGTLAALGDGSFGSTVFWEQASLMLPGFALVYDFGVDVDLVKVGLAGPSQARFPLQFVLSYSLDGSTWVRQFTPAIAAKWSGASVYYELDAVWNATDVRGFAYTTEGTQGIGFCRVDGTTITKLTSPSLGAARKGVAVSPDGSWLVVTQEQASTIQTYRRRATALEAASLVGSAPTYPTQGAACFTADGTYMAYGGVSYGFPALNLYKWDGVQYARLADPAQPGSGQTGLGQVSWSPDGTLLAVPIEVSPYLVLYQRTDDTLTKLTATFGLTASAYAATFSPDGLFLAVAQLTGGARLQLFSVSGATLTAVALSPAANTEVAYAAFSPDSQYMAAVGQTGSSANSFKMYKRTGDTFALMSTQPPTMSAYSALRAAFSPDGALLALTTNTSPYLEMYSRSGDTFTRLTNVPVLSTAQLFSVAWLPFTETSPGLMAGNYDTAPLRGPAPATAPVVSFGQPPAFTVTPFTSGLVLDPDMGNGTISGTVKKLNTPDNIPLQRRVRLHDKLGMRLIRETWSDPVTGAFSFTNVQAGMRYVVIAYDHPHQYRAVIDDSVEVTV